MKRAGSTWRRFACGPAGSLALSMLGLAVPSSSAGQVALDSVDALAQAGRTEEARTLLETWWSSDRTRSSRRDRQRALWVRALLTVDPGMAALDYQRLVVEYPAGPYSDGALVRLAMIADSDEDLLRAAGYYRTLLQDYPRSPDRVAARQWLEDYAESIEEAEAAAVLAEAEAGVSTREEDAPALGAEQYAVQLGAFSTEERAGNVAESIGLAGFETRLVRVAGNPLYRIRIGQFAERSQAAALKDEIVRLGYDATVVSDAAEEQPIR